MATKMIHRYIVNNMKSDEIQYQKLADEPSNVNDETLDEVFLIAEKDQNTWENEDDGRGDGGSDETNIRKDLHNIFFLTFLYILQGVPLGLVHSLSFIMSSRNVSYADQGTFSFALWPYAMKLLWAPFVDSIYWKRFGRRKSWLVPMQCIMGVFMFSFADYVHKLFEVEDEVIGSKDIVRVTTIFFILIFFTATQDVAVDGWGLTILSKENVSYSSTCNSAGVTAGWFIGGVFFLVFQSVNFSNKYVRSYFQLPEQPYGIITIDTFMKFFGVVFLVTTIVIMLFKKETDNSNHPNAVNSLHKPIEDTLTLKQTYIIVWRILSLPSVRLLGLILITCRIPFALAGMVYLKLIENGVPRENLGLLAVPLTPFEIALPLIVSKFTNGPTPLKTFLKVFPIRILITACIPLFVYITPHFKDPITASYSLIFYILCIFISIPSSAVATTQGVSLVAFFTRVSDKAVGGTYMTLLNTIANLGSHWPSTLFLYLVHFFSIKQCTYNAQSQQKNINETMTTTKLFANMTLIANNTCITEVESKVCTNLGGTCKYIIDAYYIMAAICAFLGVVWIGLFRRSINKVQALGKSSWKIKLN